MAPRVLAAVVPEMRARISAVLPDCDVAFVDSVAALLRALQHGPWELLVIGAHFDGSRAVAAIERVRRRAPGLPVVCVRGVPFAPGLGKATVHALRIASKELGAHHFIDLLEFPDDDAGNARVRALLERLVTRE